jgi:hypothetical protein
MSYFDKDRTDYAGSLGWAKPGVNAVGEYQASGRPFMKSGLAPVNAGNITAGASVAKFDDDLATNKVSFPYLAKRVKVMNRGATTVLVSFCSLNVDDADNPGESAVLHNKNYWELRIGEELDVNVKCHAVYINGDNGIGADVQVFAEITNISAEYTLDADNITGVSG